MARRLFSVVGSAFPILIFAFVSTEVMTKQYLPKFLVSMTWVIAVGWICERSRRILRSY